MLDFKYAQSLVDFSDCPPASARRLERIGFRFVWNPVDSKSFSPVALQPRANRRPLSCSSFGLSMFVSAAQARARFASLEAKVHGAREKFGDHLAAVELMPEHGLQTLEDLNGHFDLHEFVGVDLPQVARIVEKL